MAKHTKKREIRLQCKSCGAAFVTGSSVKHHCSVECRIKDVAKLMPPAGCWDWPGSINPKTGYGQLSAWVDDKRVLYTAHRVSYAAFFGGIPNGLFVLHRCDHRKCFNPEHLFLGSQSDNMVDMIKKNRRTTYTKPVVSWHKRFPEKVKRGSDHHFFGKKVNFGESSPRAKITEADAIEIRNSKELLRVLSQRYGITETTVSLIRRGKLWAHLNPS